MMNVELSPITGKPMILVAEPATAEVRGETIAYTHLAYRCTDTGQQFTTTELDEVHVNQVYNVYRERHGYPFPQEIAALRTHYGLSAAMMSEVMGFGANQWRYYEADKLPSESNARAICAIRNKMVFLDFLESARTSIGEKAYLKTKERVAGLPEFVRPARPTELSGYLSFSPVKVSEAVKFFISRLGPVFVTKMNKLLFYADFLNYKYTGFGMTGLEYRAITHGPVPDAYGEVYARAAGVRMEEYIYSNGTSGIQLCSEADPDLSVFNESEQAELQEVAERFRNFSAGEISNHSHRERGWIECSRDRKHIPYSYAFYIEN